MVGGRQSHLREWAGVSAVLQLPSAWTITLGFRSFLVTGTDYLVTNNIICHNAKADSFQGNNSLITNNLSNCQSRNELLAPRASLRANWDAVKHRLQLV